MSGSVADLDPRWEWHHVCSADGTLDRWVRGGCNHLEVVNVDVALTGEVVARLCVTCDTQLPPPREPPPVTMRVDRSWQRLQ
jgi:hypothetical protein